jgi:hypothetical protein
MVPGRRGHLAAAAGRSQLLEIINRYVMPSLAAAVGTRERETALHFLSAAKLREMETAEHFAATQR